MRRISGLFGLAVWTCLFATAHAQASREDAARKLADSLHYQSGSVQIGHGFATLDLPPELEYLGPKDTRTVLVDLWGNPPDETDTLGMIVPKNVDLLAADSRAVVITYEEDGHVADDDAEKIDYDDLLAEMKKSTEESNAERTKAGYEPIHLVGWAAPPKYDREGRKLYWAKELQFGSSEEHTLNYNIRILGRKGVLNLNAVAAQQDLPVVEAATPALLAAVSFDPGNRYADYDASTDKLATYGIAALVAGGVAAKLGFFKGLWIALLAFKKFLILGAVALGGFFVKLYKRIVGG